MKRCFVFFTACLLLLIAGVAAAQGAPQHVTDAFADLNRRLGSNYTTANTRWTWSEQVWFNRALGCERLDTGSLPYEEIRGFRVQIDMEITGSETWDYDYRISYEPNLLILCSPDLDSQPTQAAAPPGTTPTPHAILVPTSCPGTLASRLLVGQQARVTPGEQPNNVRSSYGTSSPYVGEIPPGGIFTILDGPECTADGAWWQVDYNGLIGWTLEGQGDEYYIEPLNMVRTETPAPPATAAPTSEATPIVCDASVPPRLTIGETARVTPGIPNNVRSGAGTSNEYLGEIPAEATFTVLAGPLCASGIAWWQVDYNGLIGWTAEGQDGEYWLEPELGALAAITAGNLERLTLLAELPRPDIATAHLQFQGSTLYVNSISGITAYRLADPYAVPDALQWQGEIIGRLDPAREARFLDFRVLDANRVLAVYARNDFGQMWTALLPGFAEEREWGAIQPGIVRISPDGRYIVRAETASGANDRLFVYDLSSGESWAIQNAPHQTPVQTMAFSGDGDLLITGSADLLVVWEVFAWDPGATDANQVILSAQAYPSDDVTYVNQVAFVERSEDFLVSTSDVAINSTLSQHGLTRGGFASTETETILWKDVLSLGDGDALLGGAYGGEGTLALLEDAQVFLLNIAGIGSLTAVRDMAFSADARLLAIQTDTRVLLVGIPAQP